METLYVSINSYLTALFSLPFYVTQKVGRIKKTYHKARIVSRGEIICMRRGVDAVMLCFLQKIWNDYETMIIIIIITVVLLIRLPQFPFLRAIFVEISQPVSFFLLLLLLLVVWNFFFTDVYLVNVFVILYFVFSSTMIIIIFIISFPFISFTSFFVFVVYYLRK